MLAEPPVILKLMLVTSDARAPSGVATLIAIGVALCRYPNPRSFRMSSSRPAYRWTVPATLPAVEGASGSAVTSTSKTTYQFPHQPIGASLAQARRLRELGRSRIGGLYGP